MSAVCFDPRQGQLMEKHPGHVLHAEACSSVHEADAARRECDACAWTRRVYGFTHATENQDRSGTALYKLCHISTGPG